MSDSNRCDTNNIITSGCGTTGWTVGDDFTLGSGGTVTGFSYNDFIAGLGLVSDYTGTVWNIWNGDPFTTGAVVASGSTVGVVSAGVAGTELVVVTGLN